MQWLSAWKGRIDELAAGTGTGTVDPFEVVARELRSLPIEIIRMVASAELTAGATRPYE